MPFYTAAIFYVHYLHSPSPNVNFSIVICKPSGVSVRLLESIFYGTWALGFVFIVCELGQQGSDICSSVEEETIQFDWYLYTLEIQQMLIPLIIYAQKPVIFEFFGSHSCSRDQLKKVSYSTYRRCVL